MHGAFDIVAGAAMALAGAGGACLDKQRADFAGATAAIGTAAEAIISLARGAWTATVRSNRALYLPAGENVAGADDHALWPPATFVTVPSPSARRRRTITSTEEIIMPSGATGRPET